METRDEHTKSEHDNCRETYLRLRPPNISANFCKHSLNPDIVNCYKVKTIKCFVILNYINTIYDIREPDMCRIDEIK